MLKLELIQKPEMTIAEYMAMNKAAWEQKVTFDIASDYYHVEHFRKGNNAMDAMVTEGLGKVRGMKLLQLQCYIGMEALSLSRKGATVTGLDFCSNAISFANKLSADEGLSATFLDGNVYDIPDLIDETYDIVFSTYGSICWLPDLKTWAQSIYNLLKPGGYFFLVDFHPLLISFNLLRNKSVIHPYFNEDQKPIRIRRSGTYADVNADIRTIEYNWNHSISEILTSFINSKFILEKFEEHPHIPLDAFPGLVKEADGYNHVAGNKYPILFSLSARKKS